MRLGRRREAELEEELQAHLAMAAQDRGAAAAAREFGNRDLVAETTRDQWPLRWLADLRRDLVLGWRGLRRNPAFAWVAIAAFALAIGANAAIYSLADAIYFHPLAWAPHENQLVVLFRLQRNTRAWALAPAEYRGLAAGARRSHGVITALGAYDEEDVTAAGAGAGAPQQWHAAEVSAGFFRTLGVAPLRGRTFSAADERPERHVAILSYGLWQKDFAGSDRVLGRTLELNGQLTSVVGVMPRRFSLPAGEQLWLPLGLSQRQWVAGWSAGPGLQVIARVGGGTLQQANAQLKTLSASLPIDPAGHGGRPLITAHAINREINGNLTPISMDVLLAAMGFLLLLACANVANLHLARASAREGELAVRRALGASRGRLIRQLLTEALLLATIGGVAGLAVGRLALHALGATMPPGDLAKVAGLPTNALNLNVLAFTFAICLGAGLLTGVAPALRASGLRGRDSGRLRGWLGHVLLKPPFRWSGWGAASFRGDGRPPALGASPGFRSLLLGVQAALALVLLTGAVLMGTGFAHYATDTRRFQPDSMLTASLHLSGARYATAAARATFYQRLLRQWRGIPGVRGAAAFSAPPYTNNGVAWIRYALPGKAATSLPAVDQAVSPGFFGLLRIPLLAGRGFNDSDGAAAPPVAIVSQELARQDWPGRSAIGRHVDLLPGGARVTVVGVAAGVEYDWTDNAPEPVIYRPIAQAPGASAMLGIRAAMPITALAAAVRRQTAQLDPELPLTRVGTLADDIHYGLASVYVLGDLIAALGVIAVALAMAGLFGVAAYNASRRRREFGVRVACGARPAQITRLVLGQGLLRVAAGMALGAIGAVWLQRAAAHVFFGVNAAADPWALPLAAALLAGSAALACYLPARRAGHADAVAALRQE